MIDKQAIIAGFSKFINESEILAISMDEMVSKVQFSPIYQAMTGESQEINERTITIKYYPKGNA